MITQEAIQDRFDEVKESDFDPTNFRLSNTGKCQRMRMLKVLGYEAEDIDDSTAQTFERGNLLEDWFVDQIINKYPRRTRREQEVKTPFGDVGHMDVWYPNPDNNPATIIEVKSVHENTKYFSLPKQDHINQVQSYMHFYTDNNGNRRADRAEIIYIFFGRKLETEPYEIVYDPEKGKEIEEELNLLHSWKKSGYVPDIPEDKTPDSFPCFWTTKDGNIGRCSYYKHCWSGEPEGEYDDIPIFDNDKTMRELIREYQHINERYKAFKKNLKKIKSNKKELEEAINTNLDIRETDAAIIGNTRLKRSKISGRTYWKPERALKQGLIDEDTLEKIRQASDQSSGYTRFYLKQLDRGDKQ